MKAAALRHRRDLCSRRMILRQRIGMRRAQHDACGVRQLSRRAEQRVRAPSPTTTISAAEAKIERIHKRQLAESRSRPRSPARRRSGRSMPSRHVVVAGERGEPYQVLRDQSVVRWGWRHRQSNAAARSALRRRRPSGNSRHGRHRRSACRAWLASDRLREICVVAGRFDRAQARRDPSRHSRTRAPGNTSLPSRQE